MTRALENILCSIYIAFMMPFSLMAHSVSLCFKKTGKTDYGTNCSERNGLAQSLLAKGLAR